MKPCTYSEAKATTVTAHSIARGEEFDGTRFDTPCLLLAGEHFEMFLHGHVDAQRGVANAILAALPAEPETEPGVWSTHRIEDGAIEVFLNVERAREYASHYPEGEVAVSWHPVMNCSAAGQFIIDHVAGE